MKQATYTLLLAVAACQGSIGPGGAERHTPDVPGCGNEGRCEEVCRGVDCIDFVCRTERSAGPDTPARRLSRRQLERTVADALTAILGPEVGAVALSELTRSLNGLPIDERQDVDASEPGQLNFLRSDQHIGPQAARSRYRLAQAIASAIAQPARLDSAGHACMGGDADVACVQRFIEEVGYIAHRRPLTEDEIAFYLTEGYGEPSDPLEGVEHLSTVLFAQPFFPFHVEGGGELTAFEAASRLSYQFWDSMPDGVLFEAAETGALLTDEGWRDAVEYVLLNPRTRDGLDAFFNEWLRFDHTVPLSNGSTRDFEYIANGTNVDETFDAAVRDEAVDLFFHVLQTGGSFREFFLAPYTTTTHPELLALYGAAAPDPDGTSMLPPEHHGLLTRSGMLMSRASVDIPEIDSVTHPILRGVFVMRQIACMLLEPAPPGAMQDAPPFDPSTQGAREVTNVITGRSPCANCHRQINTVGFALESFDTLGRHRTEEPLFHEDDELSMVIPIDDSAEIPGIGPVQGGADLSRALVENGSAGACFARHYFRFTVGRQEDLEADACMLARIDEAIDMDRPLAEVMSSIVLEPTFRTRGALQ